MIHFRIRSDNNIDDTINVLKTWLNDYGKNYFSINATLDDNTNGIDDEIGIADWSINRFEHVIKLREEILDHAKRIWADYIFVRNYYYYLIDYEKSLISI